MPSHAVLTTLADQPGMLFRVTQVLARHDANIEHIDIVHEPHREAEVYLEFACETPIDQIVSEMQARRERYGISYYVVSDKGMEAVAPIVARLAGA